MENFRNIFDKLSCRPSNLFSSLESALKDSRVSKSSLKKADLTGRLRVDSLRAHGGSADVYTGRLKVQGSKADPMILAVKVFRLHVQGDCTDKVSFFLNNNVCPYVYSLGFTMYKRCTHLWGNWNFGRCQSIAMCCHALDSLSTITQLRSSRSGWKVGTWSNSSALITMSLDWKWYVETYYWTPNLLYAVAISPDNEHIVSCGGICVDVWNVSTGSRILWSFGRSYRRRVDSYLHSWWTSNFFWFSRQIHHRTRLNNWRNPLRSLNPSVSIHQARLSSPVHLTKRSPSGMQRLSNPFARISVRTATGWSQYCIHQMVDSLYLLRSMGRWEYGMGRKVEWLASRWRTVVVFGLRLSHVVDG